MDFVRTYLHSGGLVLRISGVKEKLLAFPVLAVFEPTI
jgi:hypothetical protein